MKETTWAGLNRDMAELEIEGSQKYVMTEPYKFRCAKLLDYGTLIKVYVTDDQRLLVTDGDAFSVYDGVKDMYEDLDTYGCDWWTSGTPGTGNWIDLGADFITAVAAALGETPPDFEPMYAELGAKARVRERTTPDNRK